MKYQVRRAKSEERKKASDFVFFVLRSSLFALCLFLPARIYAQALRVPPGFEVVEFADGKLANDIHVMTVDPKGRVVVAGRGYIRILIDNNGDGKADRAIDFADSPKGGAMGLLWEGDSLYVTGDGGLRRFKIKNDKADGPSELLRALNTKGEHTAHAIRRGPDGWLYVVCGNNTGINKSYAELPTSPVKDPIAGCVLRFSPLPPGDGPGVRGIGKCEIVAHGFRNPYGMDFNLDGDLFTFDSDNERCVSLPWYEPTRFYHVIDGRHYGWMNPQHAITWRRPPYFCDVVAPIATLGRGSPTGVVCYAHNQFPPEYQGGFFLGDWTFGKIHFAKLQRKGASYTATTKVFLESTGDNGFAPTANAVDPTTGDLYISIGGRGTRGAVYRIRHTERYAAMKGRLAALPMTKRSLEWRDGLKNELKKSLVSKDAAARLRGLQLLRRYESKPGDPSLSYDDRERLANDADGLVRQAFADYSDREKPNELGFPDGWPGDPRAYSMYVLLKYRVDSAGRPTTDEGFLFRLRFMQMMLGDIGGRSALGTIWEGYTPRTDKYVKILLRESKKDPGGWNAIATEFPSRRPNVDREMARTLAMIGYGNEKLRSRVLGLCGRGSSPIDDIHYLACYARMSGKRTDKETPLVAATLLDLDRKITERKLNRDSNWAPRVAELYVGLAEKDPALAKAMVEHPAFGRADHALFANAPGFPKERAARIFLDRWQKDAKFALTANVVRLFDVLPAGEVLPTVRQRWGETGLESALLPLLAKAPVAGDRGKFIKGLNSPQDAVVVACLKGLETLELKSDADEAFGLIQALQRATDTTRKNPAAYAARLASRLEKTTSQKYGGDSKRWITWLQQAHPEFGKRLANPDGVDVAKWNQRLAKLDWERGNAAAGKAVFSKASCVTCHSGSQALGPDLLGVTGRFSRTDLLTAILQPSKVVPNRYQTTVVETKDGKTYQGIVIYDAVDSLILQTGAATTVRLDGRDVVSRYVSTRSLMPAGLLDALSDREIVDLYAYLRSSRN